MCLCVCLRVIKYIIVCANVQVSKTKQYRDGRLSLHLIPAYRLSISPLHTHNQPAGLLQVFEIFQILACSYYSAFRQVVIQVKQHQNQGQECVCCVRVLTMHVCYMCMSVT